MRGEVHILVNCPITTFLKEKHHSAFETKVLYLFQNILRQNVTIFDIGNG